MDFEGQRIAEWLLLRIIVAFGVLSFLVGFAVKDYQTMVYINGVGLALSCLLVLPDWPFFNRHQLKWLPAMKPGEKAAGWNLLGMQIPALW